MGPYLPAPGRSGGDLRSYHLMRELHRRGARMEGWFLGQHGSAAESFFDDLHVRELSTFSRYARGLWGRFWGTPFSYGRYYDPLLQEVLPPDGVLYVDHLHMAVNVPPERRHRYWLDDHNLEYRLWEEYAAQKPFPLNRVYRREAQRVRQFEWESIADSATTALPAEPDRKPLPEVCRDRTEIIPNGVPEEWLIQGEEFMQTPLSEISRLGFIGGYDWPPNREAIDWLLDEAWGAVLRGTDSSLELLLAGSNPDPAWKKFENVTVMGYIENSETFFSKVDALVVPLHMGSGTRIKILEATARGVPVITTSKGSEGLELPGLVRMKNRADLVEELVRLPDRVEDLDRQRRRAHEYVAEKFRWSLIGDRLWEKLNRRDQG